MTTKIDFQGDMDNASIPLNQNKEEVFQWTKQWYPVAVVDFLDPSRPHAIQLLGKDLVLWRDSLSKWSCFKSRLGQWQVAVNFAAGCKSVVCDWLYAV